MGQFFKGIILDNENNIKVAMNPQYFNNGMKLVEFSLFNNEFLGYFMFNIYQKPKRVVFVGDYADEEENGETLYKMAKTIEDKFTKHFFNIKEPSVFSCNYGYLINHTKKVFIDLSTYKSHNVFHPLPILTSEGNGNGLGDYYGENKELAGTWARDLISLEEDMPIDFEEINPKFHINMGILW
jgi:hypothetical protein